MKVTERDIARQFMDFLNESSDPNQFTGMHRAAGEMAVDAAADALGLGAFKKAAEVYKEIVSSRGGKEIEEAYPMMEIAGFARACALFVSKLESFKAQGRMDSDVISEFNNCLKECGVERYKLTSGAGTSQYAGTYSAVKGPEDF
jgi:hypothetical protein